MPEDNTQEVTAVGEILYSLEQGIYEILHTLNFYKEESDELIHERMRNYTAAQAKYLLNATNPSKDRRRFFGLADAVVTYRVRYIEYR
jgi:hypothetical protein